MRAKHNLQVGITTLALALTLGACSSGPLSNREKGALIGSAAGAPGTGALVGGAAGAVGGALVGDERDRRD
jgi:outer membrane protein with glycine zipper